MTVCGESGPRWRHPGTAAASNTTSTRGWTAHRPRRPRRAVGRAHARARGRVRPPRRRRRVDRARGREPRGRRHGHRWRSPDPDRPGRREHAAPRAGEQHGAVVVLVGVGDRDERDGHRARGSRTGADQRARALVRRIRRVDLCRRGRPRPGDRRPRRGPRRLDVAPQPARAGSRLAVQRGERRARDPAPARPRQRRRTGRRVRPGECAVRPGARSAGRERQGRHRRRGGQPPPRRPRARAGARPRQCAGVRRSTSGD